MRLSLTRSRLVVLVLGLFAASVACEVPSYNSTVYMIVDLSKSVTDFEGASERLSKIAEEMEPKNSWEFIGIIADGRTRRREHPFSRTSLELPRGFEKGDKERRVEVIEKRVKVLRRMFGHALSIKSEEESLTLPLDIKKTCLAHALNRIVRISGKDWRRIVVVVSDMLEYCTQDLEHAKDLDEFNNGCEALAQAAQKAQRAKETKVYLLVAEKSSVREKMEFLGAGDLHDCWTKIMKSYFGEDANVIFR